MQAPDIIYLLIQVPLVGIFVFFTLRLSRDFREDTKVRDVQWQTFIAQQNDLWRNFVKELTDKSSDADDIVAQRLFELTNIINNLLSDFKTHDARTVK